MVLRVGKQLVETLPLCPLLWIIVEWGDPMVDFVARLRVERALCLLEDLGVGRATLHGDCGSRPHSRKPKLLPPSGSGGLWQRRSSEHRTRGPVTSLGAAYLREQKPGLSTRTILLSSAARSCIAVCSIAALRRARQRW